MKTAVTILGALLVLGIIGVVSLPFVVDLNKYRAQIKQEVEKKIDGEIDFESIRFRGLGIQIKKLSIRSKGAFENRNLLEVGEARLKISLGSLLTGHPKATFIFRQPKITLVKNEKGALNLTELPKKMEESAKELKASEPPLTEPSQKKSKLPGLLLGVKLSLQIEQASLKYIDEKKRSTNAVENLNAMLSNVALNSPIDFSVKALLLSSEGRKQLFQGELDIQGRAKVGVERSKKISSVDLDAQFALGELKASLHGKITDLELMQTDLKIKTPPLSLSKIKNSFSALRTYPFNGTLSVEGSIKGPLKKSDQCQVGGSVDIHLTSGSTDLKFKSEISNTLAALNGRFTLEAPVLNLDEILPKKQKAFWKPSVAYAAAEVQQDPLKTLRESPIFRGMKASGKVDIQKVTFRASEMSGLSSRLDLENLHFSISQFALNAFGGKLNLKGDFKLDAPKPQYQLTTVIQNFNLNSLLTFASPTMRDVAEGRLTANLDLEGKGMNLLDAKQYLTGNGGAEMREIELKGLNMGKSLQDQLRLISIFAGSDILGEDLTGRFDSFKSSLRIKEGRLYTPDAVLSAPQYGATLKGFASFDKEIQYDGKVLLPAKKFNSKALQSLADNRGMIGFPFKLSGVLPKFSFVVDAAEITRMAAKAALSDSARQKLKEKLGIDLPVDLPF